MVDADQFDESRDVVDEALEDTSPAFFSGRAATLCRLSPLHVIYRPEAEDALVELGGAREIARIEERDQLADALH